MTTQLMMKRLMKERIQLKESEKEHQGVFTLEPISDDDLTKWAGVIIGPPNSYYEGCVYKITLECDNKYPMHSPTITFKTPIFHPNVSTDGRVCMNILSSNWTPVLGLEKICLSVVGLLVEPNPDSPLNSEAGELYVRDKYEFRNRIQSMKQL